jgi:AraC-like DNA-binding protein
MITLSYIFGMSTMFFCLMAWFFWHKGGRLNIMTSVLTAVIGLECVKDYVFINIGLYEVEYYWNTMTAVDMVAVPLYAFILKELIHPGRLTTRVIVWQELPFVVLPTAYIASGKEWIFYIEVGWAALYGTFFLVWTMVNIPRYNRRLKELYSYTENVNLTWLRVILYTFYGILAVWIVDCVTIHIDIECFYMTSNLVLWMFIAYFLYRHESVISELGDETAAPNTSSDNANGHALAPKIEELFIQEKVYLNPKLKLSDVTRAVGSNRTYVSNYFNRELNTTFFDYVNSLRIEYACKMLREGQENLSVVALRSGFNSLSTFHRVFCKVRGVTPAEYRKA